MQAPPKMKTNATKLIVRDSISVNKLARQRMLLAHRHQVDTGAGQEIEPIHFLLFQC